MSDYPFVCTIGNCKMGFTNEDKLEVHKKKHEFCLSLPIGEASRQLTNNEQTPTPSRIIQTIEGFEEAGIFQVLNPFEEEFKRVRLNGNSGRTLSETVNKDNESLNTPCISLMEDRIQSPSPLPKTSSFFSPFIDHLSSSSSRSLSSAIISQSKASGNCHTTTTPTLITLTTADDVSPPKPVSAPQSSTIPLSSISSPPKQLTTILPLAQSNFLQTNTSPILLQNITQVAPEKVRLQSVQTSVITPLNKTSTVNSPAPIQIQIPQSAIQSGQMGDQVVHIFLQLSRDQNQQTSESTKSSVPQKMDTPNSLVKQKLQDRLIPKQIVNPLPKPSEKQPIAPTRGRRKRFSTRNDLDEEKDKFRERNRAAATRCRLKRKQWVEDLEKTRNDYVTHNLQLQNEMAALKKENFDLKRRLLTHRNCPVTLKEIQENGRSTQPY